MANVIQLITKYATKAWDKVYKAESLSSILDGESDLIKFTGTKTVKIAKVNTTGLYNYNRANKLVSGRYAGSETGIGASEAAAMGYGYQQGNASLVWEEFTISQDRGAQYRVELFDDEETDGLAVGAVTKEVSRTQVIPEVDAYCFSRMAELAGKVDKIALPAAGASLAPINSAFAHLEEQEVPAEDQVIFMSVQYFNLIRSNNTELTRFIRQEDYDKNIKFTIAEYEGRKIYVVPQRRFKTGIKLLNDGIGGYTFDGDNINFIVCAKSAIAHIVKYDKVRIFSPSVVQDFDGYKVNVRIYHDVFVPDNKRVAIYACTSTGTSIDPEVIFAQDSAHKLLNFRLQPGETFFDGLYIVRTAKAAAVIVGNDVSSIGTLDTDYFKLNLGDTMSVGDVIFAAGNGKIVAKSIAIA